MTGEEKVFKSKDLVICLLCKMFAGLWWKPTGKIWGIDKAFFCLIVGIFCHAPYMQTSLLT